MIDNKLAPKRLSALLLGAGHHVHALIFKDHEHSIRGWILDDEGVDHLHSRDAPTLGFLISRAVAIPLYHGEYVTRVTGDYSTLPIQYPVHSMVIHLSSNRIITVSGSNKREMSMDKFDSRSANETHFEELRYTEHDMPMQICNTFFTTGRRISVTCTHVPWSLPPTEAGEWCRYPQQEGKTKDSHTGSRWRHSGR